MAEVARDAILTATLLACIFLFAHQEAPIKPVKVDYCSQVVSKYVATDPRGGKHIIWARGWGLCRDLDRYEQA